MKVYVLYLWLKVPSACSASVGVFVLPVVIQHVKKWFLVAVGVCFTLV